jgi:hypothetical protein
MYTKILIITSFVINGACFPILRIKVGEVGPSSQTKTEEVQTICTVLIYDSKKCGVMENLNSEERILQIEERFTPKLFSYTSYLHSLLLLTAPFIWIGNTTTLIDIKQVKVTNKNGK